MESHIVIHTGHNATVAYFQNFECLCLIHEEKFSDVKNHTGFPQKAFSYVIEQHGIKNIDRVIFCETEQFFINTTNAKNITNKYEKATHLGIKDFYRYLEYKTGYKAVFSRLRDYIINKKVAPGARNELIKLVHSYFSDVTEMPTIDFVDHHLSHCHTPLAFFGTNEKVLLISLDGAGDYSCSKIFLFDPKTLECELVSSTPQDASLGLIYARMTKFLGMKMNEHEYKVMGLAAYVDDPKYYNEIVRQLEDVFWVNEQKLIFESKFNTNTIEHLFRKNFVGERFDNLAAALQVFTEKVVTQFISAAIKKTGVSRIMLSGGVFMNVKLNQRIMALPTIDKVYFQPSCSDDSLVIGASNVTYLKYYSKTCNPIKSMYLGQSYSNSEIKSFLDKNNYRDKYEIRYLADIETQIAQLLANGHIIARFNGPCEWGARSLCNRGILGNASDLKTFYEVNDLIKMRDFWMPFAPTILDTWADRYIHDWEKIKEKSLDSMRYMIVTVDATELAKKHLLAAMHQKDKTIRPQVVTSTENEKLYKILKEYESLTKMGGFMNTSLNLHGSPLVSSPEQAMFTIENSGLQYLAMENFLLKKK
jgi:carbamoyltransferase